MNAVKIVVGLPLVVALLLSSCKSEETAPSLVSIGLQQSARLASNVVVRVDSIQDSRCPIGYMCLVAGRVRVKLALSTENESASVWLASGYDPGSAPTPYKRPDSTNVRLKSAEYKIILERVNPYPGAGKPGELQTAMVEVTKL